ncbi:hypothetical protein LTR46_012004 [Exophiala xenobiotica]|nr:hypothetical protein LTR46_012004 [Exophiala xenobiotica]
MTSPTEEVLTPTFKEDEPVEFAYSPQPFPNYQGNDVADNTDENHTAVYSTRIQVSNSPIGPVDGLGIIMPTEHWRVPPQQDHVSSKKNERKRINQHMYETLATVDQQRARKKRVRFDGLGASPRKPARLAAQLEEALRDEQSNGDSSITRAEDLLKLQMLALASQEPDKSRL